MHSISRKTIAVVLVLMTAAFVVGRATAPKNFRPAEGVVEKTVMLSSGNPALRGAKSSPPPRDPRDALRIKAALDRLDLSVGCEQREDERHRLILDWCAVDPQAAMEYTRKNLKGDRQAQAMADIASAWAKNDPAAAWAWARSLGADETHHSHTVLEEIGRNDPALAARFVAEFARERPDEAIAMTLTAMRAMAYGGNFDSARQLANDVPLRLLEDRAALFNFMAGQWARFEPEKAAQWVQSLPGETRAQAMIGLGESWAEVDPPRAADFASQLPPGESRQLALRQAIANWILTDPQKASTWVNRFEPSEDFDQAVAAVATMRFLMEERVDLALNWAGTIFSEPLRVTALSEILSTWAMHDRAAAVNYVRTSPVLSAASRQQLLQQLETVQN